LSRDYKLTPGIKVEIALLNSQYITKSKLPSSLEAPKVSVSLQIEKSAIEGFAKLTKGKRTNSVS
jgi:hypothetical protein